MNSYQNNGFKLQAKNIVNKFEDMLVVDDVSISLKENEFVSILGPSGSGKSTIFNI